MPTGSWLILRSRCSVQPATPDIADFDRRAETDLALEGRVPGPGFRILEDLVLRRDLLAENVAGCRRDYPRCRLVTETVGCNGGLPPRKTESLTPRRGKEATHARANHVLVVERVGDAEARLEVVLVNFRERFAFAAEQEIEFARVAMATRPGPLAESGQPLPGITRPL